MIKNIKQIDTIIKDIQFNQKTEELLTEYSSIKEEQNFNKNNNENPFDKDISKEILIHLNKRYNSEISFGFEDEVKQLIVEVRDKKTKELIRQFPSKEFFERLIYFKDNILPGLLFDKES